MKHTCRGRVTFCFSWHEPGLDRVCQRLVLGSILSQCVEIHLSRGQVTGKADLVLKKLKSLLLSRGKLTPLPT